MFASRMKLLLILIILTFSLKLSYSQSCPQFSYIQSNGETLGRIQIENDFSGYYDIHVKMAVAAHVDNNEIQIELISSEYEIVNGDDLVFHLHFPIQHMVPQLTLLQLNKKVYCTGPQPIGNWVSDFWSTYWYQTGQPVRRQHRPYENVNPVINNSLPPPAAGLDHLRRICGIVDNSISLVANGRRANKSDYPWIGALFKRPQTYWCGVSLISTKHALTAAHCVYGVRVSRLVVVFGREDISEWTGIGKEVGLVNHEVHGDYQPGQGADSDIAILTLKEDIVFSPTIRPICLPANKFDINEIVGTSGVVVGWGLLEDGTSPPKPMETDMPIVSEAECLRSNPVFNIITSNRTFCAGDRDGSGPCRGDSGGGMFLNDNGRWSVRGIVSRAITEEDEDRSRECDLSHYVVFVDVAKYVNWVWTKLDA